MISENDLFNLQKSIIYCFRNIPEFSTTLLDYLHDTLFEHGGIRTLSYNDSEMSIMIDLITEEPKQNIFALINDCYVRSVIDCINKKYLDDNTRYLENVLPEIINVVLPICCTILDLSIHSKDNSLIFKINLHN